MHILPPIHREKSIFLALLALLVLGLSLSFSTWQNLRQQKIAVEQHMVLAAKAIASGVEGNMGWSMRHSRGMRSERSMAETFFQELMASPDVLFVGIAGPGGQMLLASENMKNFPSLPEEALTALRQQDHWHGLSSFDGQQILLFARRTRPLLARHFQDGLPALRSERLPMEKRPFLILGLDMQEHLNMYQDARRAAIWQTGYILGASGVLWLALLTLVNRREQGKRVTELEHFQSQLLDNLPDGLLTLDGNGAIRSANPAAMSIFKRGTDIAGMQWHDLPLRNALDKPGQNEAEIAWRQFTFEDRFLEIFALPLHGQDALDNQTLVLVRDRTRIKTLETSLHEAQRLAAIGRLAAAVAHEIRNPLSALRGFAQHFASRLTTQEPEKTYARTMVSEADRLNRVVTDLLFLSKPRAPEKSLVQLDSLFEELGTLVNMDLENHHAVMHHDFSASFVWADPDLLKQALLNLVMNALEALPSQDGTIIIGSVPGTATGEHNGNNATGVWVFVQDNGRGMNEEERERALEPFYSTRRDGAGLGLAIVHKIMRDHGGQLDLLSAPTTGTTVRIFFPGQAA